MAQALRDPGNLGTMLRTGDAVGAGGLILIDDCADPFSVEAVRASMGAVFTQPIAQARWDEFLPWLRSGAGQLVAASLRDAVPYRGAPYAAPCFILVGNESRGLARGLRDGLRSARDHADARAAPTASMLRWPARCWPMRCWRRVRGLIFVAQSDHSDIVSIAS